MHIQATKCTQQEFLCVYAQGNKYICNLTLSKKSGMWGVKRGLLGGDGWRQERGECDEIPFLIKPFLRKIIKYNYIFIIIIKEFKMTVNFDI